MSKYSNTRTSITMFFFITCSFYMHVLALAGSEAIKGQSLPPDIIGTWQVAKVKVDTGASRKLLYQHDDPRLKGRIFKIAPDKFVQNTPEHISCTNPNVTVERILAATLIKNSMSWRGIGQEIPTPQDFELQHDLNEQVDVLRARCGIKYWAGSLGPDDGIEGVWIIILPGDRLAIRWFDDTILILSRLPVDAKPKASFNCAKAATPVEKTICGSVALAFFDQSVAESYLNAVRGFTEAKDFDSVKNVKAKQKKWIKKRNACGTNVACLEKSMEEQLEVLAEPGNFY